jgi:ABC-type transport system substrate-binding protein/DNA-binding SARP family transcriptional activator/DNA-binding beta-propeller fold protein YncE
LQETGRGEVADSRIEFRILGPLEVLVDDAAVRIGGPRQRALLAYLLVSANRVVSRDRLIEELLPGARADTADHALRLQVWRLRKALTPVENGEPRLAARPPGYVLRVEPGELDLERFEELAAEGRHALEAGDPATAASRLREAEALWRGQPLADLEFEPFARVEVERLGELRLAAVEDRIDADLALGRHAALVPELEARVAERPLRERLRGQLMLALYRCGRQADALEAYRAGRSMLVEELALDPSPALKRLEQAILRQDPDLELAASSAPVATAAPAAAVAEPAQVAAKPRPPSRPGRRRRFWIALALGLTTAAAAIGAVIAIYAWPSSATLRAAGNSVGLLDPDDGTVRAVLRTGGTPGGIASGAGAIWVTNTADDQLLRIDERRRTTEQLSIGRGPTGVAVGDAEVWVVNQLDRTVSEINPRARRQVASFEVGNGAESIAFGDDSIWVANTADSTITRIDPSTNRTATIPLAGAPGGIAVAREGVWATSSSTGQLLLLDPRSNRVAQAVSIGNGPAGVAVGAGSVWVANTPEATVSRFDPNTGRITKINVGKGPVGVTYAAGAVWVANSEDGTVSRIDPETNSVKVVEVGGEPSALVGAGGGLWTTVLPGTASHRGGTLHVAEGPPFASIGGSVDPAAFTSSAHWQVLSITNDGLVTYRRVGGLPGNTLAADLATSLPAPTDDGRTYTFRVRTGIRYSNGTLVRPSDFRRGIERVFERSNDYPKFPYTGIVGARQCQLRSRHCSLARGIVADDAAHTVTFHLREADPDFLYKLAFPWADAIPAGTPRRDVGRVPVPATGPYVLHVLSSSRGDSWVLTRNPRFHPWSTAAQPPGYPDRIVFAPKEPGTLAVKAVERGATDVLLSPAPSSVGELATRYANRLHVNPVAATFAFVMNTRVPPFDHVAARRALGYAIDRRRIVNLAGGSLAVHATCQILPPTLAGYEPYCPYTIAPSASGAWTAPDLTKAERLVSASGTSGMKVTVSVAPPDATDPTDRIGPYLVSVLRRLGYRASLEVLSRKWLPQVADSRARTQIAWFTWYADYPAPSNFVGALLTCRVYVPHSPTNPNIAEFCSRAIDRQVRRAEGLEASAPGTAGELWARIDRELTDRAPWLPLYNPQVLVALSQRVGNYQYHPSFWQVLLDQLWVR